MSRESNRYYNGTKKLLMMEKAIEEKDRDKFLKAIDWGYSSNNICCGDSLLSDAFIRVFQRAITVFLGS